MKSADYQKKIKKLSHAGLFSLWKKIEAGTTDTDGWAKGKAMEYLIIRAFELEKAEVRWPYDVSLDGETVEQIDGIVHLDWGSFLVESKVRLPPKPSPIIYHPQPFFYGREWNLDTL